MKKYFFYMLMLGVIVGMAACGSKTESDESEAQAFDDAQKEAPKGEFEELMMNLPKPSEIPILLVMTGSDYNETLINPHSRVDQYLTTEEVKALNLGVYAADLGYLSSYDKTQEALNYMVAMKNIADELGATTAYDVEMYGRFESNLGNKDSLYQIIDEGMAKADDVLKEEDRGDIAAMLTVGSFVEGLYISTQLVAQYPEGVFSEEQKYTVLTPLIRVILEQEESLNELIKLAGSVENDRMTSIVSKLAGIQAQYAALDIEDKLQNNLGDELLNDQTLKNITSEVAALRASITE